MEENETNFISLAEAAKITNYSQDYISLLCRQGKLKAQKFGRNWVTTKEWVRQYVDSTSGKGESVVPVKVVEKAEAENPAPEKKIRIMSPMQRALEAAVFCFVFILWGVNIFYFSTVIGSSGEKLSIYVPTYQNPAQGKVAGASDVRTDDSQVAEAEDDISLKTQIIPLNIDDVAASDEIEANFSEEIEIVESYGDYLVIRYKDSPQEKFLYISE